MWLPRTQRLWVRVPPEACISLKVTALGLALHCCLSGGFYHVHIYMYVHDLYITLFNSIKIHDLSDLKGVYTIIDIEEEKGNLHAHVHVHVHVRILCVQENK